MERSIDVLIEVARDMFNADTVDDALQIVVDGARRGISGCDDAAVVLMRGGVIHVPAASSEAARELEQAEAALGYGPCIQALQDHAVFASSDLPSEHRWTDWTGRAVELGYRSMLAYRLYAGPDSFGALDLFSRRRAAFDDDDEAIGLALAAHGAIAIANVLRDASVAGQLHGLRNALASRDLIGQAKGILMERLGVTADAAFGELQRASQQRNAKIRDVASQVVFTGELPD